MDGPQRAGFNVISEFSEIKSSCLSDHIDYKYVRYVLRNDILRNIRYLCMIYESNKYESYNMKYATFNKA